MRRHGLAVLLAGIALTLAFNLPAGPAELARPWAWALPLELLLALPLLLLAPQRWRRALLAPLAGLLALLLTLRLADGLLWLGMGRPIVLVEDLPLVLSLAEIGRGSLGLATTLALLPLLLLPSLLLFLLARLFLHGCARLPRPRLLAACLLALTLLGELARPWAGAATGAFWPFGRHGFETLAEQAVRTGSALTAGRAWEQARALDPLGRIAPGERLARLAGKDVLVLFVESYGRSALELEPFRTRLVPRLEALAATLAEAGLASASGWLRSPTVGGQSWLAHATLASGQETGDQGAYAAYLRHADADLAHLFAAAGHHTALVAPAILHPFPEAGRLGYGEMLLADGLGYRGSAPGWVPMPDQYVLQAVTERLLDRRSTPRRPLFLTVALVGSHAPFTPLPPLLEDPRIIGDGRIYDAASFTGTSPARLWTDPAALRDAYAAAIDLSLGAVQHWVRDAVGPDTLLILLGDHEPAAMVTGRPAAREVPVHVVAGDPALLAPFLAWGLEPGMLPGADGPVHAMASLRGFLLEAFSGPAAAPDGHAGPAPRSVMGSGPGPARPDPRS